MKTKYAILMIVIMILVMAFSTTCSAASNPTLIVEQKASEPLKLVNNQGNLTKEIINSNANTGEITIQLKLSNTKVESQISQEVFLVIDNSGSMANTTSTGQVRKKLVISSAKELVKAIFQKTTNTKIGIIKFTGDTGTINDAQLITGLSTSESQTIAAIDRIASSTATGGTNIDAGLKRANSSFSKDCKSKVIVLLTDGVPSCDTTTSQSTTTDKVNANTKKALQQIAGQNVHIISAMVGLNKNDSGYSSQLAAVNSIFGTTANPTAGKFYIVPDSSINDIMKNNITEDVVSKLQEWMTNITIVDYFPKEIVDNFEFVITQRPTKGTISDTINKTNNSITWKIDSLKNNETASVQYKLKIKDIQKQELWNKTIETNSKVTVNYIDGNNKTINNTLNSNPKIKIVGKKEDIKDNNTQNNNQTNNNQVKDNTIATGKIPQTGFGLTQIAIAMIIILLVGVSINRYLSFRNTK